MKPTKFNHPRSPSGQFLPRVWTAKFTYANSSERREVILTPVKKGFKTHVTAFDLKRREYRTFLSSEMRNIVFESKFISLI